MINQVKWKMPNQESDPIQWLNFIRPIMEWYNGRQMDAYINQELDKRFIAYKSGSVPAEKDSQFTSVIDLALKDYMADPARSASGHLDNEFRTMTRRNIRMFLFVGHDSSSSTICYCYHLLFTHPDALARIRAEHDSVLGTDYSTAPAALSSDPHLLNQLPYTNAVIKEAMRLFPAASGIRQGLPGVDLVDDDGTRYPTENAMVWIQHSEMQRSPRYWERGNEFIPERWLVGPEDPLYPAKGAWRPFEFGPRNCIGQPLVMTEIKTTLALTIREFNIVPMYDKFDAENPKKGACSVDGESVYQIEEGAAHPRDHYPCRVTFRVRDGADN
jgi:Cytochrome P450